MTSSIEDEIKLKGKYHELHEDRIRGVEIDRLMRFTRQESYNGGRKSLKRMAYKLQKTNEEILIIIGN